MITLTLFPDRCALAQDVQLYNPYSIPGTVPLLDERFPGCRRPDRVYLPAAPGPIL